MDLFTKNVQKPEGRDTIKFLHHFRRLSGRFTVKSRKGTFAKINFQSVISLANARKI